MDALRNTNWQQLYRLAVFESDPEKLAMRIEDASKGIRWRICELWDLGTIDSCERTQLDAATYFLGLLRMIAAKKYPDSMLCSAVAAGKRAA
jgi:hypothetical protein